jgi:hypothetical protein
MTALFAATTVAAGLTALVIPPPALATAAPAPSARASAGMAYDAAHGEVVLFGGFDAALGDTWTWDGVTWRQLHPAHSPSPRGAMGMTYDAARGEVVLFGGYDGAGDLRDTWTWNGTDWHSKHPAIRPSARDGMGMTYDAARGEVVLTGGYSIAGGAHVRDTWTWDGTTWTKQHPLASPSGRDSVGMAYDASRGEVVLFGGFDDSASSLGDTWTWNGTTWTREHPATSPSDRGGPGLTYDAAAAEVLLFGGRSVDVGTLGDTWTWDGTIWRVPFIAHLHLSPKSGPPGTVVQVTGTGFAAVEKVTITFIDSGAGKSVLGTFATDATGHLTAQVTIPLNSTAGAQKITGVGKVSDQRAKATFTVT